MFKKGINLLKYTHKFFKVGLSIIILVCLNNSGYANCDPNLDPFCNPPVSLDICDPNLDPFCQDVNVPLDSEVLIILGCTILLASYQIAKNKLRFGNSIFPTK